VIHGLFWSALGLLSFSYLAFPLLLFAWSRRVTIGPAGPLRPPGLPPPRVAVILSAHNEQDHIAARIENLRTQTYARDRLSIYVGSDGSSDRTVPILHALKAEDLHVLAFATQRGKASILNDLMSRVQEPVCVFTDANVIFEPDAIERLVDCLLATEAGAVCGELELKKSAGDNQDSFYWRLERSLKVAEGRIGGLLGANGAIYAIRTELYQPLPADTITDDFVIAMRIASRGQQLVYEPCARALEDTPDNIEDEFKRRVRIGIGNYQALFRFPEFLFRVNPARAFCYFSHKILRWFGPHWLLLMLLASLLSYDEPLYRTLCWLQSLCYGALIIANAMRGHVRLPRWLSGMILLAGVNVAFAVAFWRYLSKHNGGQWTRTRRRVIPGS